MYRKLIIFCLCGVLAGGLWSFAQDSQQPAAQQQRVRSGRPPSSGPSNQQMGGSRQDRPSPPDGSDRQGPPRGDRPGDIPPPDMMEDEDSGLGLEAIEEEDDTKNPLYGNPYRVIVTRNLFALKPSGGLGDVVTNVVPLALNTNTLKFMGITTIGGVVKCHFMVVKPGQQPPQQFLSLTEGQASDGLEVVKINPDPVDPTAEVRADGKQIQVSFASHGIATGGAGAAPQRGGVQGQRTPQQQQQQQQQRGGRFGPQQQPQQAQAQQSSGGGGFNMPAVEAQQSANRTSEAQNYQNRRDGFRSGRTSGTSGSTSGGSGGPPMPPGM